MITLVERLAFAEGPRWHEDRLWFSDMHRHVVDLFELTADDSSPKSAPTALTGRIEVTEVEVEGAGWP